MTHDKSSIFNLIKFRAKAKIFGITYYQSFIEAYWSIERVEKYDILIRLTYKMIYIEI